MSVSEESAKSSITEKVRERYGAIAEGVSSSCCGSGGSASFSGKIGYLGEDLGAIPKKADLGLGCGSPLGHDIVKEGDTVLDLGSGGGIDCFIAANKVGPKGKVIGVDMTPQMLALARRNAAEGGYTNVEFREGTIENLPVDDSSVDVIISNCVINLSADKEKVFRDMYRALKPGGKFVVSDITLLKPLPDFIKTSLEAYIGCVAGAMLKDEFLAAAKSAGFADVSVLKEESYRQMAEAYLSQGSGCGCGNGMQFSDKILDIASAVTSVTVMAQKPTA
ncbi:MAG: arsenite methyltransferase [Nitrospinota bacterium]|nr:arsenite methyltransferase [Nitrospinota bacterium]